MKASINANKAKASTKLNDNIANENNCPLNAGFLATPLTNAPNIIPVPTPDPHTPIVANPAPTYFNP